MVYDIIVVFTVTMLLFMIFASYQLQVSFKIYLIFNYYLSIYF